MYTNSDVCVPFILTCHQQNQTLVANNLCMHKRARLYYDEEMKEFKMTVLTQLGTL